MSSDVRKNWLRLILPVVGAVAVGISIVSGFVTLLSLYGMSPQEPVPVAAAQAVKFPENEQMLTAMTDELAREGAALQKVEPAAGTPAQPSAKK